MEADDELTEGSSAVGKFGGMHYPGPGQFPRPAQLGGRRVADRWSTDDRWRAGGGQVA